MDNKIEISKRDIAKTVYFISNLTQMQDGKPMQGALSSKGDYMGGIFDRWINIIPEAILFNRIILPKLLSDTPVSVITDYYDYDPKTVGIAPDVIGIKVGANAIPFVEFDNKWKAITGRPQIEVKTFKQTQKMVSLRNQNYQGKYLVLAETSFRVDYLVPLIDSVFYTDDVYESLHMDDDIFIKNNDNGDIKQSRKVDRSNDNIGSVDLLRITSAESFMKIATYCNSKIGIEYFSGIKENTSDRTAKIAKIGKLSEYGKVLDSGLFQFNQFWYDQVTGKGKKMRDENSCKTIDVYVEAPDRISVVKICKSKLVVYADDNCKWENTQLERGKYYDINIIAMDRGGGEEYFLLKSSIPYLEDCEESLLNCIKQSIEIHMEGSNV